MLSVCGLTLEDTSVERVHKMEHLHILHMYTVWRMLRNKHACTDQRHDKRVLSCEVNVMETVHYLSLGTAACLSHEAVGEWRIDRKLSIPKMHQI